MVKFLQGYYMILITKRRKVGLIGKHYLFKIEDTVRERGCESVCVRETVCVCV